MYHGKEGVQSMNRRMWNTKCSNLYTFLYYSQKIPCATAALTDVRSCHWFTVTRLIPALATAPLHEQATQHGDTRPQGLTPYLLACSLITHTVSSVDTFVKTDAQDGAQRGAIPSLWKSRIAKNNRTWASVKAKYWPHEAVNCKWSTVSRTRLSVC